MFKATLDTSEFEQAKKKMMRELRALQFIAVSAASRAGAVAAKSGGRFKNQTGETRARIRIVSARLASNGRTVVGGFESPVAHSSYLEEGTRAHVIRPINYTPSAGMKAHHTVGRRAGRWVKNPSAGAGRGKFLRFYVGGQVVFAREVHHPGTAPDPFMGPASIVAAVRLQQVVEEGVARIQASVWD